MIILLRTLASMTVLPLDANHLLQRRHDLHEVFLLRHDAVDVLVGLRELVEDAAVLPALDALGLPLEVPHGERFSRLGAAHATTGAVGSRLERERIAPTAYDVRARAH